MSRTAAIAEADYEGILARLAARGYDAGSIQRMRQEW